MDDIVLNVNGGHLGEGILNTNIFVNKVLKCPWIGNI